MLGGRGQTRAATWRNVEECHGRKKGVGDMSMSMVLFSVFLFTLIGVKDIKLFGDATDGWNWMELVVPIHFSQFFGYRKKSCSPIGSGLPFDLYVSSQVMPLLPSSQRLGGSPFFGGVQKLQWMWVYAM